jgi:hypothetical protein
VYEYAELRVLEFAFEVQSFQHAPAAHAMCSTALQAAVKLHEAYKTDSDVLFCATRGYYLSEPNEQLLPACLVRLIL